MAEKRTSDQQIFAVEKLKNYISNNINADLTLDKLSQVVHYSPFHLQKVFKELVGKTPKQYINSLRAEFAIKHIILKPKTPLQEIAKLCSYSSASVFSRFIKKAIQLSPEQLRLLPFQEQVLVLHRLTPENKPLKTSQQLLAKSNDLIINTCFIKETQGIILNGQMQNDVVLKQTFTQLKTTSIESNLHCTKSTFYGLISPDHRGEYTCFLALHNSDFSNTKLNKASIKGGLYATYNVTGGFHDSMKALHFFHSNWLPTSGYKLSGISGFESFGQDPTLIDYTKLKRKIYIPIVEL